MSGFRNIFSSGRGDDEEPVVNDSQDGEDFVSGSVKSVSLFLNICICTCTQLTD